MSAALTPRVRTLVVCDGIRASRIEENVFHLRGARLHVSAPRFPARRRLRLFVVLSSPRPAYYPVVDPSVAKLSPDAQAAFVKSIAAALEKEGVAYDIDAYRDAPPGLRIWCGSTIERADVEALTLWLDWAFARSKDALRKAA